MDNKTNSKLNQYMETEETRRRAYQFQNGRNMVNLGILLIIISIFTFPLNGLVGDFIVVRIIAAIGIFNGFILLSLGMKNILTYSG